MTDPFSTQGPPPGAPNGPEDIPPQAPLAPQAPPGQPPFGGEQQIPQPPQIAPGPQDLGTTQVFPGHGQVPPSYVNPAPPEHNHAGFGERLLAWILDRVIMLVIIAIISIPIIIWMVVTFETEIGPCSNGINTCEQPTDASTIRLLIGIGVIAFAALAVLLLYQLIGLARTGKTPGRRIMHIRVIKDDTGRPPGWGGALIRVLVGGISGQLLYIGHLWRLWDDDKQTWHDKAANTVVIRD